MFRLSRWSLRWTFLRNSAFCKRAHWVIFCINDSNIVCYISKKQNHIFTLYAYRLLIVQATILRSVKHWHSKLLKTKVHETALYKTNIDFHLCVLPYLGILAGKPWAKFEWCECRRFLQNVTRRITQHQGHYWIISEFRSPELANEPHHNNIRPAQCIGSEAPVGSVRDIRSRFPVYD